MASPRSRLTWTPGDPHAGNSELTIPTEVADPAALPLANGTDTHTAHVVVRDGS